MKSRLLRKWKLLGGLGILIALVLMSSAMPAQAFPQPGHHFYGRVIGCDPGAVISAKIKGV